MIKYDSHLGVPRPPGTEFRQRLWYPEDGGPPHVVSVVETQGGQVIEAKPYYRPAVVAEDLQKHGGLAGVLATLSQGLLESTGWTHKRVVPCPVRGCPNGQPLWAHERPRPEGTECVRCEARTVLACAECGKPDSARYITEIRERMLRLGLCFGCNLWTERVERPPDVVTPEGLVYGIGNGRGSQANKGFGGQPFTVRFFDGRVVETDDLWCGGTIPQWFRDRLPANGTIEAKKSEYRQP